jgi:hypothetical protein
VKEDIMSASKQELKLRVEAKINELKAQLATGAADGTAEAQRRKEHPQEGEL